MKSIECKLLNQSYSINLINGSMAHCCRFKYIEPIENDLISLDWQWIDKNPETVRARQDLKTGIKTPRCSECWKAEEKNQQSWRQLHNNILKDGHVELNLELSNLCNQACYYCIPELSTSISKFGSWVDKDGFIELVPPYEHHKLNLNHVRNYIKNLNDSVLNLVLGITGGEPFIVEMFDDLIEEFITSFCFKKNNRKFLIVISTNTNVRLENLFSFYEKIKKLKERFNLEVHINSSIENIEDRAEYVRYGLKWNNFLENFKIHNTNADQHNIRMTVNPFTIVNIKDFVQFFKNYNVEFRYNFPWQEHMRSDILDERFLPHLTALENYVESQNMQGRFTEEWYKRLKIDGIRNNTENAKIFKIAISNIDKIRKTNWRNHFPEYIEWYDEIGDRE